MSSSTTPVKMAPKFSTLIGEDEILTTDVELPIVEFEPDQDILEETLLGDRGVTIMPSTDQSDKPRKYIGSRKQRLVKIDKSKIPDEFARKVLLNKSQSIDERLKNSEKNWKSLVNKCSDVFDENFRNTIISRFNGLSKFEDWEDDDTPVTVESAKTSLDLLESLKPDNPPYIGCDTGGNIRFDWGEINTYVRITCFPEQVIRWHMSYFNKGKFEKKSGKEEISKFFTNKNNINKLNDIVGGNYGKKG